METPYKTAWITGASSGIGQELAMRLAEMGVDVGLTARRREPLEALTADIVGKGGRAVALPADVTDREAMLETHRILVKDLGSVDLLIANAGIGYPVKTRDFNSDKARKIYEVNVFGALNAIEAVLPDMLEARSGHIVGISSLASYASFPGAHVYCATKSALSAQLEGMRLELRPKGVDVTTICPGYVRTPMTSANREPMPFLMDLGPACDRIMAAILGRDAVYNFPKRLYALIKVSRLLPDAVLSRLTVGRK